MMDQAQTVVTHPAWRFVWPLLVGLCVFLAGLILRRILFARFQRFASRTKWVWDDLAVEALRKPFAVWCLIAAIYVSIVVYPLPDDWKAFAGATLSILWLISVTLAALKLSDQLIQRTSARTAGAIHITSLTQNLTKGIILVFGGLTILNSMGISITPMLTALGVGGIAVALALQDTLSNLFSGIYTMLARQVRVGDYIKLESGEEGYVADISWRSARIRTLSNNVVIIPNTKLAQAVVTNFDLPSKDLAVLVEAGADYRSDLEKVERVTVEVAREVMKSVPGAVPEFEPFIRFHTFGESGVNFTVILRAKTFVDQYLIRHEFVKRLHRRYAQEGISFPFPVHTVFLQSSASGATPPA